MPVIPGANIVKQGTLESISDDLGTSPENLDPPEGDYFYTVDIRARNEQFAEAKARSVVRLDYPLNTSISSLTLFYQEEDSYNYIVGVEDRLR